MTSPKAASPTAPAKSALNPIAGCVALFFLFVTSSQFALSGEVRIVDASADCSNAVCQFEVTLAHDDTGWEHYANAWVVLAPDGRELGRRTLYHPHVNEQPFTRSLSGVTVPTEFDHVMIQAHDSRHKDSPTLFRVNLP